MSVERKINLRKQMKVQLKAMDGSEKAVLDQRICEHVLSLPEITGSAFVYGYRNLTWETGTEKLLDQLWNKGIQVALPKVMGDRIEFFHVRSKEDLEEGTFHILEPKASCEPVFWPKAPVLVPGLAFSENGSRLGKGGGYYDKFLAAEPDHLKVALAYEFQMTDQIPLAEHDRPVDMIVTEKGIYRVHTSAERE